MASKHIKSKGRVLQKNLRILFLIGVVQNKKQFKKLNDEKKKHIGSGCLSCVAAVPLV